MPGVVFPPVGPVGLGSPPALVLCSAKTAPCPSQVASLVARVPDTLSAPCVRGVRFRLVARWKLPCHARAFGLPVPHSGYVTRRQVALPSSRATPMDTCPTLRPRWCPEHLPWRTRDCCLPATGNRRRSPHYSLEGYPTVHDYTHFGAPSRGLHPRYTRLRPPP